MHRISCSIDQMRFTKRDLIGSVVTGLTTGIIVWRLAVYLRGTDSLFGVPFAALAILIPVLWVISVNFGYFLGRWFAFFNQFGKYVAIGFTNAAVDFGVFNFLYVLSGITLQERVLFVVFKASSFIVAALHSYFWNKKWAFDASESRGGTREFAFFFVVNCLALIINAAIAYAVAQMYNPSLGITEKVWANIGLIAGSATALVFSFIGFKMVVFKK